MEDKQAWASNVLTRWQPHTFANCKVGKVRGSVSPHHDHLEPEQSHINEDLSVQIIAVSFLHLAIK